MSNRVRHLIVGSLVGLLGTVVQVAGAAEPLRPPAVPLVACDPYFSIWSPADHLNDRDTEHWTGKPHRLLSVVTIDGKPFRVMGGDTRPGPRLHQTGVTVLPTRTLYSFEGSGIALTLTFMTPALPEDIDLLSRPVTYATYEFRSTDGREHTVAVSFDASGELAVNTPREEVVESRETMGDLVALKVGAKKQAVLQRKGDDLRIDWGYLYVAAPAGEVEKAQFASVASMVDGAGSEVQAPAPGGDVVASVTLKQVRVSTTPVSQWLMLAYDDLYSIQYMKQNLRPYWRRNGWEAADLLKAAENDYPALLKRCAAFDKELVGDLTKAGGEKYAQIAALAYRQCFAAGKFVADSNGQPLSFCKENHSNGCIATSDVFYPMAPQFLLFGPSVAKSFLVPFMNYAASERWKFDSAPHDLGTYPKANGQVYGGENSSPMPVEESGNLLILMAAVAQMEGNADFAGLYWPTLTQWAEYLKAKGFDPENQLCTDDFAGHLAHNINLSAKAICGLGAYGKLCAMRGEQAKAEEYLRVAREYAAKWVKEADDGDHFRLAFDRPGTWSQKYNLVWDRLLELNLFPEEAKAKDMAYYRGILKPYGLPLDSRKTYTKLDWTLWTATLTQNREDFEALVNPVFDFLNEAPDRSPMTDFYETPDARKVAFTARPVVGGVFLQMLYDKQVWKKYASRDVTRAKGWAPIPTMTTAPAAKVLVPTAKENPSNTWRYTIQKPAEDWVRPGFEDQAWKEGKAGFGTAGTPGAVVGTRWSTDDIWLRREITLPDVDPAKLCLIMHHDEDAEVYINGVLAANEEDFVAEYEPVAIRAEAARTIRPGNNTIAVHCHQTVGGQYIDVGVGVMSGSK